MSRLLRIAALLLALVLPVSVLVWSNEVRASAGYASPYTLDQTYSTALRLLRVDLGFKVTEKDAENGYILFEYTSPESGKRVCAGAIELVKSKQHVQVTVQIPAMPQYHEQMIADALSRKLSADYGEPVKKTAPSDDDAGAPPPDSASSSH